MWAVVVVMVVMCAGLAGGSYRSRLEAAVDGGLEAARGRVRGRRELGAAAAAGPVFPGCPADVTRLSLTARDAVVAGLDSFYRRGNVSAAADGDLLLPMAFGRLSLGFTFLSQVGDTRREHRVEIFYPAGRFVFEVRLGPACSSPLLVLFPGQDDLRLEAASSPDDFPGRSLALFLAWFLRQFPLHLFLLDDFLRTSLLGPSFVDRVCPFLLSSRRLL